MSPLAVLVGGVSIPFQIALPFVAPNLRLQTGVHVAHLPAVPLTPMRYVGDSLWSSSPLDAP
jgi:hypothetical protein